MHALTFVVLLTAASTAVADAPVATAERSPGDMSVAERTQMMAIANTYNSCVFKESMARSEGEDDIRRIADLAMGSCQPQLDELRSTITGWGFPEYFATGFSRTIRDHAARNILPELAVRKGN